MAIGLFLSCFIFCTSGAAGGPVPAKSDAIVLLAGNSRERGPVAAALFHDGYADRIILTNDGVCSSWSTKYNRNLFQVEWTEEDLVNAGVPRERIVRLPFYGSSTMHDALAVRGHVVQHDLKKLVLVTSDYHVRRALWSFREVFADHPVEMKAFPSVSTVGRKGHVVEFWKFQWYRVRYGMLKMFPIQVKHEGSR